MHYSKTFSTTFVPALLLPNDPTPPFRPLTSYFADDGTLWAVVRQYDSGFRELAEYNTLRHYDMNGKLVGSFVPRSLFKANIPDNLAPALLPSLSTSDRTIGVYFDKAKIWMELAYDGKITSQRTIPKVELRAGEKVRWMTVHLTPANHVVRIVEVYDKKLTQRIDHLQPGSGGFLTNSVDISAIAPLHLWFVGVDDGDHLVSLTEGKTLRWAKLNMSDGSSSTSSR